MAGNKLPPTSQLTQKSLPTIYITRRETTPVTPVYTGTSAGMVQHNFYPPV